jgi:NitT/TauT family transport system substrate-binding protein
MQDRRDFLKTGFSIAAAGLAGAAALTRARRSLAEEAPPETTSVRLLNWNNYTCLAPIQILDDLLRDEGFADVRYVPGADSDIGADRVANGDVDFCQDFAATTIPKIDAGVSRSHAGRGASSLFRAVRPRIDPQRRRSPRAAS